MTGMAQCAGMQLGAALLVHAAVQRAPIPGEAEELGQLAAAAGASPVAVVACRRSTADRRTLIGAGQVQEVQAAVQAHGAACVIFSCTLSPSQERSLEQELGVRVLDRTGLILEIFARRARTHEGQLQVELALLEHEQTRLVRGWTHLERQKGGFGLRGGPGETQIELDRRAIRTRIGVIRAELETLRRRRAQNRRRRRRSAVPVIALVGYTNAGKSTLFNRLTAAAVPTADQLFATLDPTLRGVELARTGRAVFADTVGFIRELPHELIAAFRATLEETALADLQLHVVDASDPCRDEHMAAVDEVLRQIGAADVPRIEVFNKSDLVEEVSSAIVYDCRGPARVSVSARTGQGVNELLSCIDACLAGPCCAFTIRLAWEDARLRALLYDCRAVEREYADAQGRGILELRIRAQDAARIDRLTTGRLRELCPSEPWQAGSRDSKR